MASIRQKAVKLFRQWGLLESIDHLRYLVHRRTHRAGNAAFTLTHPGFHLPPPGLAYDAFGHTSAQAYYLTGRQHAAYFSNLIKAHLRDDSMDPLSLCEWGCGPARILRHMPQAWAGKALSLHGFDYNARTIEWCSENIPGIHFKHNALSPPLAQETDSFDVLYGVSVLTHLSKAMHFQWIAELSRVVKPNGLILLTTHGDLSKSNLLPDEREDYERGELVVRGKVEEGKRTFVAYHPPTFVRDQLLANFEVLTHITNPLPPHFTQDIWVARNTKPMCSTDPA